MDFALRVEDDALGEQLVVDAGDALEDVTERPMPQIVQQRGG